MDEGECRAAVLAELQRIAPEIEPATLQPHRPLREQVDLDSMDWLNFLIALSRTFKIDIAEADYERLRTLDDLVSYLRPHGG
jgi:acyl carrier protein